MSETATFTLKMCVYFLFVCIIQTFLEILRTHLAEFFLMTASVNTWLNAFKNSLSKRNYNIKPYSIWRLFYGCKQFNSNIGCTNSEVSWTVYKKFRMSSRNKLGIPPHSIFSSLLQYWTLTKDLKHSFLYSKTSWLGLFIYYAL